MKLFGEWFLIKRPKLSVLSKSKEYENGKLAEIVDFYCDKKACAKYGFEDGYVKCLEDLGINHTIDGHSKQNNQ